jgi:hypothetical protein
VYRWEFDVPALQEFDSLTHAARVALTAFMDAVVLVDPFEYQRAPNQPVEPEKNLRTLWFGRHSEGLVTFLIYPPDDLVLVVKIQWLS